MLISSEKEQILLPSENGFHSSKSTDKDDFVSPVCKLPNLALLLPICTEVDLAPEHRRNEVEGLISNLEDEIAGLRLKQRTLDVKRRESLNKLLDLKGSIRVFCRIRPFLSADRKTIHEPILAGPEKVAVRSAGIRKEFEFDKVFAHDSTQEEVFVEVEPILRSALDGHNVCILAYGQTGTGKTFTMEGGSGQPGIVPRALKELMNRASINSTDSVTFSISMLEVYMGSLKDLLAPKQHHRIYEPISRCNIHVQTDPKGAVEIEGLTNMPISDCSKAMYWYNRGRRARSTSCTNVNDMSSRSHCLTRISIIKRGDPLSGEPRVSKLWMVDLGGSERLLKTGATGQRMDEGRAINLSLSALGDVIAALRRRRCHVPYRNSKLTQILRDSLGDGSKVMLLVHASPCEEDIGETVCSLSFAIRARAIEPNQVLPEDIKKQRQRRIAELSDDIKEAEEEQLKLRSQIQKAEFFLIENRKLLSTTPQDTTTDEVTTPRDPKSPITSEKRAKKSSLPRFMTSTVNSRQRQNSAERDMDTRAKMLRSSGTRPSIQLSVSQSIGHLDHRFKAILGNSKMKPRDPSKKNVVIDNPIKNNNVELKTSAVPRNKVVTSSNPSFSSARIIHHRRRMSDFH
ncbi:hypothetical protein V2J09_001092 [Rumex salicifolius]